MATRIDFAVLVRLVLKLFGLVLVMYALVGLASGLLGGLAAAVDEQGFPGGLQTFAMLSASPLVLLVAGLVLWLLPAPIANTVLADAPADDAALVDWSRRLESVVLLGLGLYFFIDGAIGVTHEAVYQLAIAEITNLRVDNRAQMLAGLIASGFEIALGLVLVLGRRGLLGLITRLREGGLNDAASGREP